MSVVLFADSKQYLLEGQSNNFTQIFETKMMEEGFKKSPQPPEGKTRYIIPDERMLAKAKKILKLYEIPYYNDTKPLSINRLDESYVVVKKSLYGNKVYTYLANVAESYYQDSSNNVDGGYLLADMYVADFVRFLTQNKIQYIDNYSQPLLKKVDKQIILNRKGNDYDTVVHLSYSYENFLSISFNPKLIPENVISELRKFYTKHDYMQYESDHIDFTILKSDTDVIKTILNQNNIVYYDGTVPLVLGTYKGGVLVQGNINELVDPNKSTTDVYETYDILFMFDTQYVKTIPENTGAYLLSKEDGIQLFLQLSKYGVKLTITRHFLEMFEQDLADNDKAITKDVAKFQVNLHALEDVKEEKMSIKELYIDLASILSKCRMDILMKARKFYSEYLISVKAMAFNILLVISKIERVTNFEFIKKVLPISVKRVINSETEAKTDSTIQNMITELNTLIRSRFGDANTTMGIGLSKKDPKYLIYVYNDKYEQQLKTATRQEMSELLGRVCLSDMGTSVSFSINDDVFTEYRCENVTPEVRKELAERLDLYQAIGNSIGVTITLKIDENS